MRVMMLGLSHRTAPLALREAVALSSEQLEALHQRFAERFPQGELVTVTTCNRVELYATRPAHQSPTTDDLRKLLVETAQLEQQDAMQQQLAAATVSREQDEAVAHLFRVGCGIDSMVIGEPEILGQIKRAYHEAQERQTVGPVLHHVFQQAITSAKRVRRETGIDQGRVSVASIAVDFAMGVFEGLSSKTILALGSGQVTKTMAKRLLDAGAGRVLLANRTAERAQDLAAQLSLTPDRGGPRHWDDLPSLLVEADLVLTGTGATKPILTYNMMKRVVRKRRSRPLVLVDVAMPRDIDPAVSSLSNLYLYDLDDLQQVVEQTLSDRGDLLSQCRQLADAAATSCLSQVQHRDVGQLVKALRHRLQAFGEIETERTKRKATNLSQIDEDSLDQLLTEHTHRLLNKVLHLPLSQLDARDENAPLGFYAAALRKLFDLDTQSSTNSGDAESAEATPESAAESTEEKSAEQTPVNSTGD